MVKRTSIRHSRVGSSGKQNSLLPSRWQLVPYKEYQFRTIYQLQNKRTALRARVVEPAGRTQTEKVTNEWTNKDDYAVCCNIERLDQQVLLVGSRLGVYEGSNCTLESNRTRPKILASGVQMAQ